MQKLRGYLVRHFLLVFLLVVLASLASAQSGSLGTKVIQIDSSANLYPGDPAASLLNPPALYDWVLDSQANTDVDPLTYAPSLVNSIAIGLIPNVTSAAGGAGHWNGVRIVDGVGGAEQDQFVQGGKENDVSTWNIGPSSIGSGKYDITQAYLAHNNNRMFFGMERRTNNGTTAFDFEFNTMAPNPATPYIPTRTVGDILFTFEMQGSGGSGSAVPHIYKWDGASYVEFTAAQLAALAAQGLVSSINQAGIQSAPWGFVDSGGSWVIGEIPRFQFAEAAVPYGPGTGILDGVTGCGGFAYVQVRTRSSTTDKSDLKDTTRIFKYVFGGPTAEMVLTPECDSFEYSAEGSEDALGGTDLDYSWEFIVSDGVVLSGTNVTIDPLDDNRYTAGFDTDQVRTVAVSSLTAGTQIQVKLTVTDTSECSDTALAQTITVYSSPSASAVLTGHCEGQYFEYAGSATGGSGNFTYQWAFYDANNVKIGSSTSQNGTFTTGADGTYFAKLTVTDLGNKTPSHPLGCDDEVTSNTVDAVAPMAPSIIKKSANALLSSVRMELTAHEPDTIAWEKSADGVNWQSIVGEVDNDVDYSSFEADDTNPTEKLTPVSLYDYSFIGLLYEVQVRVKVSRTLNGHSCNKYSNVLKIAKLIMVDP